MEKHLTHIKEVPSTLYKYLPIERIKDIFIHNTLRFSQLEALNDPVEGIYDNKQLKSHLPVGHNDILPTAIATLKNKFSKKNKCILSLSMEFNNRLMWAHYTNNSGICIGFNTDSLMKDPTNEKIIDVVYESKTKDLGVDEILNGDNIKYKHADWHYEKEIRIIADKGSTFVNNATKDSKGQSILVKTFSPSAIKEIFIGPQVSLQNIMIIISMIRNNEDFHHVQIYSTYFDGYDLCSKKNHIPSIRFDSFIPHSTKRYSWINDAMRNIFFASEACQAMALQQRKNIISELERSITNIPVYPLYGFRADTDQSSQSSNDIYRDLIYRHYYFSIISNLHESIKANRHFRLP